VLHVIDRFALVLEPELRFLLESLVLRARVGGVGLITWAWVEPRSGEFDAEASARPHIRTRLLYEVVGMLLGGYWEVAGRLLGGCWGVVGRLLGGCWVRACVRACGRWVGGGWKVGGRWVGGGWKVGGRWVEGGWEVGDVDGGAWE
jgi:hypothetical protein